MPALPSCARTRLFDADFCNLAGGWEKGLVEKNVQDSRRRIWIEAQTRQSQSFDQLTMDHFIFWSDPP